MNIIHETDTLQLANEYETAYLTDKHTRTLLMEDHFQGDPTCGLIDDDGQWALVGGDHLTLWTPTKWWVVENEGLVAIHDLRVKDFETVELLIDPWSEKSAIWEMNTSTFAFTKIQNFDAYKDQAFSQSIIW